MKYALSLLLAVGLTLFIWIGCVNREYLSDYKLAPNPDAITYLDLGQNVWLHGEYSRRPAPPYTPDFKWTPVFPVLAGGVNCLLGSAGVFILNILLSALSCLIIYRLAEYYVNAKAGAAASCLFALDTLIWSLNFQAMSDIVFVTFVLVGLYFTLPTLFPKDKTETPSFWRLIPGGLGLSAAILTRPTGLYLPIVILLCYVIKSLFSRTNLIRSTAYALIFFVCSYSLAGLWMFRNYQTFGIFTLSGNENIVMVYYTGGGAWQTEFKCTLSEAQEKIQKEFNLPSDEVCHNADAFGKDPAEIDRQLKACKRDVLLKYPVSLIKSALIGVPKALIAHETGSFAALTKQDWQGTDKLFSNSPVLVLIFVWSVLFQVIVIFGGLLGIIGSWFKCRDSRWIIFCISGIAAYFVLTMGLSGADCCARYRLPLMPILIVFAAIALTTLWERFKPIKD
ncbi:MAG: glycosyltransferase family 39 protein [Thermoguttaceae bacterium]|nr:glycosyltransferase family 39 protein [Thermoguttaceae bacterium]